MIIHRIGRKWRISRTLVSQREDQVRGKFGRTRRLEKRSAFIEKTRRSLGENSIRTPFLLVIRQMVRLSPLEYYIIHETMCGPEPFFVLLGSELARKHGYETLTQALHSLVDRKLLQCTRNGVVIVPTIPELIYSCVERKRLGESLNEPSDLGATYEFEATEEGIKLLQPEDQPR